MSKQPWKKVLYVQQDYEDNYVDETFLNDLEKNLNLKTYELGFLVKESSVVAQEVTSVVLFVSLFCHLERSTWDPLSVLLGALVIAAGGHVCCYLGNVASDYWLLIRDGEYHGCLRLIGGVFSTDRKLPLTLGIWNQYTYVYGYMFLLSTVS
jgi:hypothetical protein